MPRFGNDPMYLLRDRGRWRQSRPSRRGWRRDGRHGGSRRLAAIPARVTDGSSRLEIWCAISAQMVGNLISRQGSHPVSCRTGDLCAGTRMAWPDVQPTSGSAEMRASYLRILMRCHGCYRRFGTHDEWPPLAVRARADSPVRRLNSKAKRHHSSPMRARRARYLEVNVVQRAEPTARWRTGSRGRNPSGSGSQPLCFHGRYFLATMPMLRRKSVRHVMRKSGVGGHGSHC